jgi:hypothetical protein
VRATLPPEIIASIALPTWHALFAAFGAPRGTSSSPAAHDVIAVALRKADLEPALARALHTIAAFAVEQGRVDIYNAAAALRYAALPHDATSPADLVARLIVRAAADAKAAELLAAAQILRDRAFRPRAMYVFIGKDGVDPEVGEPTQYVDAFTCEVTTWAALRGFGAVTAVNAAAAAGVLSWEILHEGRAETLLLDSGIVIARPQRSHLVEYDARARRLRITTDCMEAVAPLASAAGVVLFDDVLHFTSSAAVDLYLVQQQGAAALAPKALAGKLKTTAIGGTWHSGKDHAVTPRGTDFFRAIQRYKIRIEGGRLDVLTLRSTRTRADDGPAQCDVVLGPPHLLRVSEPELAPLVYELLDEARITNPAPRIRDFMALQPWIGSRAWWIDAVGEEGFAWLLDRGLLVADRANRMVAPPGQPFGDRTATAYPFGRSRFLAVSPDPIVPPFVVTEDDLVVHALSFERLAAHVAKELGLEDPAAGLDDDGVLRCGRRMLGPAMVVLYLLTRPVRPATEQRLRDEAGHGHAILILPEGRMRKNVLRQLPMPRLAGPYRPLLGAAVRGLRLESQVETTLYAPEGTRIVVHRATMRVWIDGVLCEHVTEMHVRLLEVLIEHEGQLVHTKDIAEHVAQGDQHVDTTRRAVESFYAAVEKSFKALKKKPPKDLRALVSMPKHGKYRLEATGFVD